MARSTGSSGGVAVSGEFHRRISIVRKTEVNTGDGVTPGAPVVVRKAWARIRTLSTQEFADLGIEKGTHAMQFEFPYDRTEFDSQMEIHYNGGEYELGPIEDIGERREILRVTGTRRIT